MFKILFCFLFCFVSLAAKENSQEPVIKGWDEYYQNTLNVTKPQYTLWLANYYFESEKKSAGLAVDLGTGTGKDTLYLLEKGWKVLALDAEQLSIDILLNRVNDQQRKLLEVMVSPFSDMKLPDNVDLINASYSLPFNKPEEFPACWQNIIDHLAIGGRFSGQFFGENDEWAYDPALTIHTQEQMQQLFSDQFEIEYLQIEEGLLPTAAGAMKHWHVFHVIAKKIK